MATFTIDEIQDALDRPAGKRAIEPTLRETDLRIVNYGEFICSSRSYLHHGVGGFAVVYRVKDTATGREAAFRCWKRSELPAGAKVRSEALDRYLKATPSPYLVPQRFFPGAIYVQKSYHPAVLMDWVNGRPLREVVEEACAKLSATSQKPLTINPVLVLAEAFENMVLALQAKGVAHGDLQHDNILVRDNGSFCLVDYDSVFVPGMTENEICPVNGVEGYGHPDYLAGNIPRPSNAYMDTFAAVVIALSLHVLAAMPERFGKNTTQNLLLSSDDIADPNSSSFVQSLCAEFTSEPIASLLSSFVAMRYDSSKAQSYFSSLRDRRLKRASRLSRIIVPQLPSSSIDTEWKSFASTQFVASDHAPPPQSKQDALWTIFGGNAVSTSRKGSV